MLDLRGAYAIRPFVGVHEASIAVHDPSFYAYDDGDDETGVDKHWYAEAGFVTLPPQYYYGLAGGTKLHLRADYVWTPTQSDGSTLKLAFGPRFNDPETTALYPFAVDAVAGHFQVQGGF